MAQPRPPAQIGAAGSSAYSPAGRGARTGRRRGDRGSGTAIGVAMMFPMLMLVIVLIQILSDSTRAEQALQATANRAARVAALCCYRVDGTGGAVEIVRAGLASVSNAAAGNRVYCNNDMAGDASIVFIDVSGGEVDSGPVPPGGTAYVFIRCRIPPQIIGGFGIPSLDAERLMVGTATIDPFRSRPDTGN